MGSCRTPARIERSQQTQKEGKNSNRHNIGPTGIRGHRADKVNFLGQELNAQETFNSAHNRPDIFSNQQTEADTDRHADQSHNRSLNHKKCA
ncbi:hypothetical protein EVA_13638 [gut metagenome]|uniref:Uncharacterized protein n=1 Tax=gut metagenome TaxID=749906 RepID=J9CE46_9ZZZZ